MRAENFPKVANINGILMGATPHRDGILMAATLAANENKVAATLMPLVPKGSKHFTFYLQCNYSVKCKITVSVGYISVTAVTYRLHGLT